MTLNREILIKRSAYYCTSCTLNAELGVENEKWIHLKVNLLDISFFQYSNVTMSPVNFPESPSFNYFPFLFSSGNLPLLHRFALKLTQMTVTETFTACVTKVLVLRLKVDLHEGVV